MKAYGVTLLRLAVGAIYLMHAYLAVAVTGPTGTASFIGRVTGLPHPTLMAWAVIAAYALGGLLLVLGAFTRWAAAMTALVMAVALVRVHLGQGFFLSARITDPAAGRAVVAGYEYVLLLLVASLALLFLGSGPLALRGSK
jgi:putative oxidoreductase